MDQCSDQHSSTDVLEQDVGCPACGYNLRGLGSDVVVCPECGLQSDVAVLLVRRWDKPWYRAPRYNMVCLPAAVVLLSALGWVVVLAVEGIQLYGSRRMLGLTFVLIGLALWSSAMARVWKKMDGVVSAGFALLAHMPIVGYLASIVLFISGVAGTIDGFVEYNSRVSGRELSTLIIGVVLFLSGIGVFVLSRWIERLVAGHCIRWYLRRPTTSG